MDTHCGSLISQQPLVDLLVARIAADQAVIAEKFESTLGLGSPSAFAELIRAALRPRPIFAAPVEARRISALFCGSACRRSEATLAGFLVEDGHHAVQRGRPDILIARIANPEEAFASRTELVARADQHPGLGQQQLRDLVGGIPNALISGQA